MKKVLIILLTLAMVLCLFAGCGSSDSSSDDSMKSDASNGSDAASDTSEPEDKESSGDVSIGVCFPSSVVTRWGMDYDVMKGLCDEKGYTINVQYADDNVATQISQMESFISQGVNVIIITPVDGQALAATCDKAADAGISVISYDRMIRDTESVTYYATFDNYGVGAACGQYIVDKLGLENNDGPFNVELFTGDIADNNAKITFEGAMSILQPYIDSGVIVVKSGQTTLEQCVTQNWDGGNAQTRMENILSANYADANLDAVMSTYCGMSLGCISALKAAGYGSSKDMPIVTAQDAEAAAVKSIQSGELTMSILKDSRVLAEAAVGMIEACVNGEEYPVNDTTTYDNGACVLKTYLGEVTPFDKDSLQKVIIDSGFMTQEEIDG